MQRMVGLFARIGVRRGKGPTLRTVWIEGASLALTEGVDMVGDE